MPNAKLGAKVDRYSFFVRLLPPLLHTGLARRTNIPITRIDRLHALTDLSRAETVETCAIPDTRTRCATRMNTVDLQIYEPGWELPNVQSKNTEKPRQHWRGTHF